MNRNTVRALMTAFCVHAASCQPDRSDADPGADDPDMIPDCVTHPAADVECYSATECPGGENQCQHRVCDDGKCHVSIEPLGTRTLDLVRGDCRVAACDGNGGTDLALIEDPFDDGNDCTIDTCVDGETIHRPVADGAQCVLRARTGLTIGSCSSDGICVGLD